MGRAKKNGPVRAVKMTLNTACPDKAIRDAIQPWVEFFSKMMETGGKRALYEIYRVYNENPHGELPSYTQKGGNPSKYLRHIFHPHPERVETADDDDDDEPGPWKQDHPSAKHALDFFEQIEWPLLERTFNYGVLLDITIVQFLGNCRAHATNNMDAYIGFSVVTFLLTSGIGKRKKLIKDIRAKIKNEAHEYKQELNEADAAKRDEFVKMHREYLDGIRLGNLSTPGAEDLEKKIMYFTFLLNYQERKDEDGTMPRGMKTKRFCPIPVYRMGRHHVQISGKNLWYVIRDVKGDEFRPWPDKNDPTKILQPTDEGYDAPSRVNATMFSNKGLDLHYSREYFPRIKEIETERKTFRKNGIYTDGVSVSFLFDINENVAPGPAQPCKKEARMMGELKFPFVFGIR